MCFLIKSADLGKQRVSIKKKMSTNLILGFNHNDIFNICSVFRTFFLPRPTCSGTSSGKGSSNHHQVRSDHMVCRPHPAASSLEAEGCSRCRWGLWVQASVEQVDQQVDPEPIEELQGEQRGKGSSEYTS